MQAQPHHIAAAKELEMSEKIKYLEERNRGLCAALLAVTEELNKRIEAENGAEPVAE